MSLTYISPGPCKHRVPFRFFNIRGDSSVYSVGSHRQPGGQGIAFLECVIAEEVSDTQSLEERAMVENPPDTGVVVEEGIEHEEGRNGLVGGFEGRTDVDGDIRALGCVDEHQVVVVVTRKEQSLAYDPLVVGGKVSERFRVPRPEDVGERAIHGSKVANQLRLLPLRRADGQVERPRAANSFLYQVCESPGSTNIRRVCRIFAGNTR